MLHLPVALWVALGSALGASARWLLGLVCAVEVFGLPTGTLFANVLGSFAIGLYAALVAPEGRLLVSPAARQFVMAGLCGGFTTFSLFSLEALLLFQQQRFGATLALVGLSLAAWLFGVWAGHGTGERFNRLPAGKGRRLR